MHQDSFKNVLPPSRSVKKVQNTLKKRLVVGAKSKVRDKSIARTKSIPRDKTVARTKNILRENSVARTKSILRDKNVARTKSRPRDKCVARTKSILRDKSVARTKSIPRDETVARTKSIPRDETVASTKSIPRDETVASTKSILCDKNVARTKSMPREKSVARTKSIPRDEIVARTKSIPRDETVARTKSTLRDKNLVKSNSRPIVKPLINPLSQERFKRPPSTIIVKIKKKPEELVQIVNDVRKNEDSQNRDIKENVNNREEEENIIDTQVVSNVASQEPHKQEKEQMRNIQMKDLQAEDMQVIEDHCEDEINSYDTNLVRINLRRCMYNVVENVARTLGMRIIRNETDHWDVYWSDYSLTTVKSKNMTIYQRINHFPGMANLESKAFLAFHLNRMRIQFPEQYNFFPKSWSLPFQQQECIAFLEQNPREFFILKPSRGAEGKGIKIFSDVKEVENNNIEATCQMYLTDILLLDGFKFDLRLYVLITSIDPLEIFVYENGLVRLATCPYDHPNMYNIHNQYMHLTNYSINKSSKDYDSTEEGSKRDFATLSRWLQTQRQDENKLWRDIDDIIIKTIISIHPFLKEKYEELFLAHLMASTKACFEILGFDIILDSNIKPYLLEVNRSPSFNISGPVDSKVKRNLIYDTFKLLNLHTIIKIDEVSTDLGNYRRIYPTDKVFEYDKYIMYIFSKTETTVDEKRQKKAGTTYY